MRTRPGLTSERFRFDEIIPRRVTKIRDCKKEKKVSWLRELNATIGNFTLSVHLSGNSRGTLGKSLNRWSIIVCFLCYGCLESDLQKQ